MQILKYFYQFISYIKENRHLIFTLSYMEFKEKYLGNHLGILWAILRPLFFMLVLSLVFSIGLRKGHSDDGYPFYLWLICGMVPWFFFTDSLNAGCKALSTNSYLVKTVGFKTRILPLVKILSILIIHFILILIIILFFLFNGYSPSIYWLQLPFYVLALTVLLLGISFFTSAVFIFINDIAEIISLVVQFGFWLTPIFWNINSIGSEKIKMIIQLNPVVYITEGFRDCFIYHQWFWQKPYQTLEFMLVCSAILIFGGFVFHKLRPHFGDVL